MQRKSYTQVISSWLAISGCVLLLLSIGTSKAGQNIGALLLILALLAAGIHAWRAIFYHALTWATLAWIAAVFASTAYATITIGIPLEDQTTYAWRFSRLFLIPLLAWGIAVTGLTSYRAYLLLYVGFVIGALYYTGISGWPTFFNTEGRVDITGEGVQFYGLLSASALVAALIFGVNVHHHVASKSAKISHHALWIIVAAAGIHGILISQARGALVGLIVVAIGAVIIVLVRYLGNSSGPRWKKMSGWAFSLIALVLTVHLSGALQFTVDRFQKDASALISGPDASTGWYEETSMGIRMNQWKVALTAWNSHALFGTGPDGARHIRADAELPERSARAAPHHFHNMYLDILARFGLIGTLAFGAFFTVVIKMILSNVAATDPNDTSRTFVTAVAVLTAVAGLTQTYWTSQVTWFYLAAIFSPILAHALPARSQKNYQKNRRFSS